MNEPLTGDDRAPDTSWQDILAFERAWPTAGPAKDRAIRARFRLSPARYHQRLNRLIDEPDALRHDPMLVRRLRRLRDTRRVRRQVRRLGEDRAG